MESPPTASVVPSVVERDPAYFAYYAQLTHQQNMLADTVRTNIYRQAIHSSAPLFTDRVVMDLGAGSGVLSFFACQAGARQVYAVEASSMAEKLEFFLDQSLKRAKNTTWLRPGSIRVVGSKVEQILDGEEEARQGLEPHSVDILISEPMGVLLVHERMLESYLYARDHFLKKEHGIMYPSTGTIHLAPFTDAQLWLETMTKARWWNQTDFQGIDWSPLFPSARTEYFSMPVVGPLSPLSLLCARTDESQWLIDFRSVHVEALQAFRIPLTWRVEHTGLLHGLAGWFDVDFIPRSAATQEKYSVGEEGQEKETAVTRLTTHPGMPLTHWQQVRFLLREPLAVNAGDVVRGHFQCQTNAMRSYNVSAVLWIASTDDDEGAPERRNSRRTGVWALQDQVYNYSSLQQPQPQQQQQQDEQHEERLREWMGMYTTLTSAESTCLSSDPTIKRV